MKSHMLSNKKRPYNNSNQVYLFIAILNYLSINLAEYIQKTYYNINNMLLRMR